MQRRFSNTRSAACTAADQRPRLLVLNPIFSYDVGKANGTADGIALSNAALVGRARAKLQKGDNAGAAADAALVPSGF